MYVAQPFVSMPNQCDIHHALMASSHSSSHSSMNWTSWIAGCFGRSADLNLHDDECTVKFTQRAQWIISSLNGFNSSNRLSVTLYSHFLASKITTFMSDFASYYSKNGLNLKIAQQIYSLALELKRHESIRKVVWGVLPQEHQALLHRLSPWSADLNMLSGLIPYQCLEDGDLDRALPNQESLTDFERGRLFWVHSPRALDDKTVFPLTQYPGYYLEKTSVNLTASLSSPSVFLQIRAMGRINEVFRNTLEISQKTQVGGEDSKLYLNQLRTLFSCYRAALCDALDLPVSLPVAMGRQGEWTIWPDQKITFQMGTPLTEIQLKDLHRFFMLEKLWKISLLSDEGGLFKCRWVVSQGKLLQEGVLPLPTFIEGDIEKRHASILERFKLDEDAQKRWEILEEKGDDENDAINNRLEGLQSLLNLKKISQEELINPSPQTLLMICLIGRLNLKIADNFPNLSTLTQTAQCMLSVLFPELIESPYIADQVLNRRGETVTETFLLLKEELKTSLLMAMVQKMEPKAALEEFISSNLKLIKDDCLQIGDQLLKSSLSSRWLLVENLKTHLMLHCDEFLKEWEGVLRDPITDQEQRLGQLLCLRKAASLTQVKKGDINTTLHSLLHEWMIKKSSERFLEEFQQILSVAPNP